MDATVAVANLIAYYLKSTWKAKNNNVQKKVQITQKTHELRVICCIQKTNSLFEMPVAWITSVYEYLNFVLLWYSFNGINYY